MKYEEFKKEILADKGVEREYKKLDLSFELSKMLIKARLIKNFTQANLARILKTKQSSIARLESGEYLPSLTTLVRIAKAYNAELIPPRFSFMAENYSDVKCAHTNVTYGESPVDIKEIHVEANVEELRPWFTPKILFSAPQTNAVKQYER